METIYVKGLEYIGLKRLTRGYCLALESVLLKLSGGINLILNQENFVETTKHYWWDGTESGAYRLDKKLAGKKFDFKNGIK